MEPLIKKRKYDQISKNDNEIDLHKINNLLNKRKQIHFTILNLKNSINLLNDEVNIINQELYSICSFN